MKLEAYGARELEKTLSAGSRVYRENVLETCWKRVEMDVK